MGFFLFIDAYLFSQMVWSNCFLLSSRHYLIVSDSIKIYFLSCSHEKILNFPANILYPVLCFTHQYMILIPIKPNYGDYCQRLPSLLPESGITTTCPPATTLEQIVLLPEYRVYYYLSMDLKTGSSRRYFQVVVPRFFR